MATLRSRVNRFFDNDAEEYLEAKYIKDRSSFMYRRKVKAAELILRYLAPRFDNDYRVLDVGCGPGILADVFSDPRVRYSGIDVSGEMLRCATAQCRAAESLPGKMFIRGDVEQLPFKSNSFDDAVCLGVIEYLADDDRLLAELARIVKPRGYLLVAITNRYAYNLSLERMIDLLRRNRLSAMCLSYLKEKRGLGHFKQMDFVKRRHAPAVFSARLEEAGFSVLDTVYVGLNLLPYPLNHLSFRSWNEFANRVLDDATHQWLQRRGEGCLVVGRKKE